jgi:hypothetical protein
MGDLFHFGLWIINDSNGFRAHGSTEAQGTIGIGRASAGGNPNDNVAPGDFPTAKIMGSGLCIIFTGFDGTVTGFIPSSDKALHHLGRSVECGHAFYSVKDSDAATGSGAHVNQSSSMSELSDN